MSKSYLGDLSKFALRPTVDLADGSAVILTGLVPLAYTLLGKHMPDSAFQIIGTLVGVLIISVVFMRAITAPYFVWKEQRANIERLESEVAKPEMLIRQRLDQQIAESRIELSGFVVRLRGLASQHTGTLNEYKGMFIHNKVQELVSHLSYDATFKALWTEYMETMFNIVQFAPEDPLKSKGTAQRIPPPPGYSLEFKRNQYLRYWSEAGERADAIQEKLVNHLLLKG
jgi:hypothetical protein